MRLAVIDEKKCYPEKCGNLCEKICPRNKLKEKCIIIDKTAKINEKLCVGCGICANRCPFSAIKIVNTPEKIGNLVYRYGENKFALYNLPVPKKGIVIGLVGRNGIGKSTAIKILAKKIKIIPENFPTILKVYLKEEKTISYKPQVLEQVDVEKIDKSIIKEFNVPLWVILGSGIFMCLGTIYGGQRIIKTVGRKIYKVKPVHGISAELSSSILIFACSIFGIPVSTTQVTTAGVTGTGTVERKQMVKWREIIKIFFTWIFTIPGAALISGSLFFLFSVL